MGEKLTYPIVIKLEHPVQYGSELISEVRFGMPKGKHLRLLKMDGGSPSADSLEFLAGLAGQPPSVFDEMALTDIQRCTEILGKLFQPSPPTSKTP